MTNPLTPLFQLDPAIHFLNHGSFGACPTPVFESYQAWQRRLERQPVLFLGREYNQLLRDARQALAEALHAGPDDLVFVPNATHGVNIVARSLRLEPGDEILSTDHEYGACDNTWNFLTQASGATYRRVHLPLPLPEPEAVVELLWQAVTPRTRLIFLSHITSPTAQRLPVEAICQRARGAGILTLVDGAHAPGQIPLDLPKLGADFYTGNCHKWLLSPKGAGFLYARPECQALVQPLVVSWGYSAGPANTSGSRFVDILEWTGTHDPSAALSVPAALYFMQDHDWPAVQARCQALLHDALAHIQALTGLPSAYPTVAAPAPHPLPPQLGIARLPPIDLPNLKAQLYDRFQVEVPLTEWNGQPFVRISVQAYNTPDDLDALVNGLQILLAGG